MIVQTQQLNVTTPIQKANAPYPDPRYLCLHHRKTRETYLSGTRCGWRAIRGRTFVHPASRCRRNCRAAGPIRWDVALGGFSLVAASSRVCFFAECLGMLRVWRHVRGRCWGEWRAPCPGILLGGCRGACLKPCGPWRRLGGGVEGGGKGIIGGVKRLGCEEWRTMSFFGMFCWRTNERKETNFRPINNWDFQTRGGWCWKFLVFPFHLVMLFVYNLQVVNSPI